MRRYAHPSMAEDFTAVILAAGHGTRMRSALPKVLHPVCGRPMLHWVIAASREAGAGRIVCVTRPGEGVAEALPEGVESAEQRSGEGTAEAVLAARAHLEGGAPVLILSADHPLISAGVVADILATHEREGASATLLTTEAIDPTGYGRVVRTPEGEVERLVETKSPDDVPSEILAIREINVAAYAFDPDRLLSALDEVGQTRGERYLTDVFSIMRERGDRIAAHRTDDVLTAMGVNTRVELMAIERHARRRILEAHALAGVTFTSPESTTVDADVEIGEDTTIAAGVSLHGSTRIGAACQIGPHTTIVDAALGDRVSAPHSYLVGCEVMHGAAIGPFSYLRPGARVGEDAKVGAFVEVKNSTIGRGAKVPHLSYIGDAEMGEEANVAAGNITANYDGREKHRTIIGARAKTGVHSSFVAPVRVGEGAYTGAGSVITEDVPDGALGISRPEQRNVEGYAERAEQEGGSE